LLAEAISERLGPELYQQLALDFMRALGKQAGT
jgi:hypothetical protein